MIESGDSIHRKCPFCGKKRDFFKFFVAKKSPGTGKRERGDMPLPNVGQRRDSPPPHVSGLGGQTFGSKAQDFRKKFVRLAQKLTFNLVFAKMT